jgi:hypothetical protein
MRRLLPISMLCALAACGGAVSDPTEPLDQGQAPSEPTAPPEPYTIEIEVEASGDSTLEVRGTTNLPDNSLVIVFASRAFRYESESDIRATNVAGDGVTVSDGTFSTTLDLDESNLLLGLDLDPIEVISSTLDVCAEFRTGEESSSGEQRQPDPTVVEIVGPYGEALENSPQVTVFGSATGNPANWLEATEAIQLSSPALAEIEGEQGSRPREEELAGFCVS